MTPDPLAELRDWHLPDPVGWWPPAPGWWLLALLCLLGAAGVWSWWRRRRGGAVLRAALAELAALRADLAAGLAAHRFAAAVSLLLRRVALARYPRTRVAGLSGAAWLSFLDATGGGSCFSGGPGRVLAELPYRPADADPEQDPRVLADLAERWIRAQRGATP